jgi:KaiC/GvpD/RAD55 family RecA-like ATPase
MRTLEEACIKTNWDSFVSYLDRRVSGIQTGITALDSYLLGLGGVTVIQGDTGTNKSTLMLQIALNQLMQGHPALIIDRENGQGRLRSRLTCQLNGISETDLLVGTREQRLVWVKPVTKLPFYIYTESVSDFVILETRIKEMADLYPEKPLLLIIDSLQALVPVNEDQRVSLEKWLYWADGMKVQYDGRLTILATSEVRRAAYEVKEAIGRAKGTNAVEYKAEVLLNLKEVPDTGEIKVEVAKNRDNIKGATIKLRKVFADPNNNRSFTFCLEGADEL